MESKSSNLLVPKIIGGVTVKQKLDEPGEHRNKAVDLTTIYILRLKARQKNIAWLNCL